MSVQAAVQNTVLATAQRTLRRPHLRTVFQVAFTVLLITWLFQKVNLEGVVWARLHVDWLALGVLTTVPQFVGCALRWCFTAQRLGTELSLGRALREYYLSSLAGQLLPSGLLGDALRALRHGRAMGAARAHYGLSLRAVVLERFAGQLVLWSCVLVSAPLWFGQAKLGCALSLAVVFAVLLTTRLLQARFMPRWLRTNADCAHKALFQGRALLVQAGTSLLTIGSCVAMFGASAMALGAPLDFSTLVRIAPLVLASMSLPVGFAGWGVRELATTGLYAASGLDPALGAATSLLYGLMCLAGSLPGALFALSPDTQE